MPDHGRPRIHAGAQSSFQRLTLTAGQAMARAIMMPLVLAWKVRLVGYPAAGQMLSLIPGATGILLRRAWYTTTLTSCGHSLTVQFGSVLQSPESRIGNDCFFADLVRVGLVDIGDDFMAADAVHLLSGMHHYDIHRRDAATRALSGTHDRITIGSDVWVGTGAVVGADVSSHSVIGAGAVVTRKFAEWQILAGVPARPVGERGSTPATTSVQAALADRESPSPGPDSTRGRINSIDPGPKDFPDGPDAQQGSHRLRG